MNIDTSDGPEELIYSNQETLISDMTFLIIVFLNRGAVITKITRRSANDFAAVLRMLVAKYGIRANEAAERRRRAEAIPPDVVTLPRISACFAQLTTILYTKGLGRSIANFTQDFGIEIPPALFSPMFASVVRSGYEENGVMINIHPQLILIAILNDNVLHVRDRVTPLDQIWTYYLAAYGSKILLSSARIEQCNIFKITINGKFNPVILNTREITAYKELEN